MKRIFVAFALFALVSASWAEPLALVSPNGKIVVTFDVSADGAPSYAIAREGREIVGRSALGLMLDEGRDFATGLEITDVASRTFDETWTQVWGEQKEIRNRYNEEAIDLRKVADPGARLTLVFRVFDDGVGFRYAVPEQAGLGEFAILDEKTEFAMAEDFSAWWFGAFQQNRYEYLYKNTPLGEIDVAHTPLTMTGDGLALSIHEAALVDYSSMALRRTHDRYLEAELFPWSDGVKVRARAPMKSPWRTIQIADDPAGLITSYLILNLNEPNRLEDTSWIKPCKYVGIWWEMHLGKSTWNNGEKHGATTENTKRYIDFASKYGFGGVLVEGWNKGWEGSWVGHENVFSFLEPYPDFDLEGLAAYAAEKGVSLIGHHETGGGIATYERQMDDAYALYERLGVKAVKSGYVAFGNELARVDEAGESHGEWHHGQWMVRHYQKSVEETAAHHIMLNIHEPIKDTGLRRTWPNLMSREGARGQEFDAWSDDGGNPPDHTTILPFTRLLSGPMDFTPGTFDLFYEEARPNNRVNTTLAKQLALYVVIYSPLQMASDLPENYLKHRDAFQFIVEVPVDWEETLVPNGQIGDYVTIVRKDRNSDDWYLGSITDEKARRLTVALSFLEAGRDYTATIYRDGPDADWERSPYAIEIERRAVKSGESLEIDLAPGGGQAIRFAAE